MEKLKFEKPGVLTSFEIEVDVTSVNDLRDKIKAFESLLGEPPLIYSGMEPANFSIVMNDSRGTHFAQVSELKDGARLRILDVKRFNLGKKYLILQNGFTLRIDRETTFILHY